ncbi:MAG: rhomboid family intramembrane serine protease, partial [Flavobacteriales bacterium]
MQHTPPVVKNLVIINALMLIVKLLGGGRFLGIPLDSALGLHFIASPAFEPWQLVTHMFMHGDFWHLFMNMFGLFMIGSPLEYRWGSKRFLNFYLLCGLGGAALNMAAQAWDYQSLAQGLGAERIEAVREQGRSALVSLWHGGQGFGDAAMNRLAGILYTPMMGASGAIFGILA